MRGEAAERDQPVDRRSAAGPSRTPPTDARPCRCPSTNSLPSQNVRPERKQILATSIGGQPVIRIDPEADRAAGEHGGADVVADRVAGEARQRRDAVGHVLLADGSQREEIVECQRAERADHAQRGERDTAAGGISVNAIRITPVSTPLRVRTRVVIAKAMMRRLAAIRAVSSRSVP